MTEERTIAYLLEELPAEEMELFEDECFAKESWPEEVDSIEGDLIDAYLRRELSPERRERFENNYLTTSARQERVAHAAALLRHVDERNAARKTAVEAAPVRPRLIQRLRPHWPGSAWGLRAAAVFAALVVVIGLLWFLVLRVPSTGAYATLTLGLAGNNRSGQGSFGRIRLPKGSGLKASLKLPEAVPSTPRYKIELDDDDGTVMQTATVAPEDGTVTIVIPASELSPGKYVFKLFAIPADGREQRVPGSYDLIVE